MAVDALGLVVALMDGFVHAWIWVQLEARSIVIILIVPVLPLLVTAVFILVRWLFAA